MLSPFIESCQELVFPSCCLECGKRLPCRELPLICSDCLTSVQYTNSPQCTCCGIPFEAGQDHLCELCLKKNYAFDLARVAMHYQEPVTSLISSLKFNGSLSGLSTLAQLAISSTGIKELSVPDVIVPVPLHIRRLRERKFNQAVLISHSCFPNYKEQIKSNILVRHRATSPQTGLNGNERRKNLSGAFSLKDMKQIKGKSVLLVDDVFTTGQTAHECAKVLKKAGAKRIEVFTLARAVVKQALK